MGLEGRGIGTGGEGRDGREGEGKEKRGGKVGLQKSPPSKKS